MGRGRIKDAPCGDRVPGGALVSSVHGSIDLDRKRARGRPRRAVLQGRCCRQSLSDYLLTEIIRLAAHTPNADVLHRAAGRSGSTTSDAIVEAVRSGRDRP